jgi:hypothetical protein
MFCSPRNSNNKFTCFSNESLIKIAESYNKKYGNKGVLINIPKKITNNNRKELWDNIQKAMQRFTKCSEDYCLLETDIVENLNDTEINEKTFRPEKPLEWYKDKNMWLSTIDIAEVMEQYEDHSDFEFIGPVPIDFDYQVGFGQCIANELCKFNMEKYLSYGKKKIGVIFNLDPHYMNGSHWTAMYSNFNKGGIYYFDSYAIEPPNEVKDLMKRIADQGNRLIENGLIDINKMDDEHTCYSSYTIIDSTHIKLDNVRQFLTDTPVWFGNKIGNSSKVDKQTYNTIKSIDGNIVELVNPISTKKGSPLFIMKGFIGFSNYIRFQYKNSECGVYSMHFISQFLEGKTFKEIINKVIDDDTINKKRDYFYRPNIEKKKK